MKLSKFVSDMACTEHILSDLYSLTTCNTWISTTINNTNETIESNSTNGGGGAVMPPLNPPSLTDILNTYPEYRWAQSLGLYVFPVLVILGTIGNSLTFTVMCRQSMICMSTCYYLAVMAVADTMVLYFSGLRQWILVLNSKDPINLNSAACKSLIFLTYFSFQISVWLLVAMTVERFIGIHFPLKAPTFTTVKRAKKVTVLLILIIILINCHFFWTVDIHKEQKLCMPTQYYNDFHDNVVPWIDAILYSFLPFVILIVLNILIICDSRRAVKFRASVRRNSYNIGSPALEHHHFHQKLTIMLLTVSFMFLVTSSPKVTLFIVRFDYFDFSKDGLDIQLLAVYMLVSRITGIFTHLTHAMNFLLYCVTGQRFRKELRSLFRCKHNESCRFSVASSTMHDVPRTVPRPSETSMTVLDDLRLENISSISQNV